MDTFGVKHVGKEDSDHLMKIFEEFYVVDKDWDNKKYFEITMDFDYVKQQFHILMTGYCDESLILFWHECKKWTNQPHQYVLYTYGAKTQYAKSANNSAKIGPEDTKFI